MRKSFTCAVAVLVLLTPLISFGQNPQVVKTHRQLLSLLTNAMPYYTFFAPAVQSAMASEISSRDSSFTPANARTPGVDEADIVITDGDYIYQLTGDRLLIIHAQPADALSVSGTITFADANFYPQELYVDGDRLAVIGSDWGESIYGQRMMSFMWMQGTVKTRIYDITKKSEPRLVRELELTGTHLTSRKVGDFIYVIARKYPDFYSFLSVNRSLARQSLAPKTRDTRSFRGRPIRARNPFRPMPLKKIFYFPGFEEPSYLIFSAFSIKNDAAPANNVAYLGAGDVVYASISNLYVSVSQYPAPQDDVTTANTVGEETLIHKFAINGQAVAHQASGSVPGRALNEFSLDEHDGLFRIATTKSGSASTPESSGIYILDGAMNTLGALEGLAPGERIYAARFTGPRAYLVTFEQIDPFFVIDLSQPDAPSVLGELKIPGFSNYLHPYDENHVIGIGQETTIITNAPEDAPWMENMVISLGMKVTLFDVQDVSNPLEKSTLYLGDRGTYSEALWNHKAILFDRDLRLLAFPISMTDVPDDAILDPWISGETIFNGAAIMDIGLDTGVTYRDGITHVESNNTWWQYDRHIRRIMRINNAIYCVSDNVVTAHDIDSLAELSRVVTGISAPPTWFFPVMEAAEAFAPDIQAQTAAPR